MDKGLEKKAKDHELKKHAAAIHCSNSLSLLQRKICNALLYHAYHELLLKEEHEITVKQLCKLIAYQGNNHAAIKVSLKGLLSTVIEWNLVNDETGTEDWTASSILASVSLQGPLCFYAYSPRMKQLLHSPSMFGKIDLAVQSRFKSSYGLALYENCIRYRGLPQTKWFDMPLFRKLMGIPEGKYIQFRDFKRRVLDKSIEEVNAYTDLLVDPELAREKRSVVKIRFHLKERKKQLLLIDDNKQAEQQVNTKEKSSEIKEMQKTLVSVFGLTAPQASLLIKEYGCSFITEKITVIETSQSYQKGKVKNRAAYLMSALKNDYQISKVESPKKTDKLAETVINKRAIDEIKTHYFSYREEMIDQTIESLVDLERQKFFEAFYQSANAAIQMILKLQRRKYKKETILQSPQVKALLRQFALQHLPMLQHHLMSIEDFVEDLPKKKREIWKMHHKEFITT